MITVPSNLPFAFHNLDQLHLDNGLLVSSLLRQLLAAEVTGRPRDNLDYNLADIMERKILSFVMPESEGCVRQVSHHPSQLLFFVLTARS